MLGPCEFPRVSKLSGSKLLLPSFLVTKANEDLDSVFGGDPPAIAVRVARASGVACCESLFTENEVHFCMVYYNLFDSRNSLSLTGDIRDRLTKFSGKLFKLITNYKFCKRSLAFIIFIN